MLAFLGIFFCNRHKCQSFEIGDLFLQFNKRTFDNRMGHEVIACDSGEAALSALKEQKPELVICDFRMPGVDGKDVYRRAVAARPELTGRFAFCTGDTASKDMNQFLQETGCRRLGKPFDRRELAELVGELGADR